MNKVAIYPGSFDPFTNGHLDIAKRASAIFDKTVIIIGVNVNKKRVFDANEMKIAIEKTLKFNHIENCEVIIFNGLIAEYAKQNNISYMVRGLRNNMDYNYEENIAEVNKLINPRLEYVYLRANNVALSSSMVRELQAFGLDFSKYIPTFVAEIMDR